MGFCENLVGLPIVGLQNLAFWQRHPPTKRFSKLGVLAERSPKNCLEN